MFDVCMQMAVGASLACAPEWFVARASSYWLWHSLARQGELDSTGRDADFLLADLNYVPELQSGPNNYTYTIGDGVQGQSDIADILYAYVSDMLNYISLCLPDIANDELALYFGK